MLDWWMNELLVKFFGNKLNFSMAESCLYHLFVSKAFQKPWQTVDIHHVLVHWIIPFLKALELENKNLVFQFYTCCFGSFDAIYASLYLWLQQVMCSNVNPFHKSLLIFNVSLCVLCTSCLGHNGNPGRNIPIFLEHTF